MSVLKMFSPDEDRSYNSKDLKEAEKKWVTEYKNKLNIPCKLSVIEKANLKRLLVEFNLTNVIKVIEYYVNNYEHISYIKGYPSVNAMYGFRRTLFPEVLHKTEINYDFNTNKEEENGREESNQTGSKASETSSKKRLW